MYRILSFKTTSQVVGRRLLRGYEESHKLGTNVALTVSSSLWIGRGGELTLSDDLSRYATRKYTSLEFMPHNRIDAYCGKTCLMAENILA